MSAGTKREPLAITRRDLLKAGGALVVSFGFAPVPAQAQAPRPPGPDLQQVDSWIAIHADNTATIYIGFAELGQGASTALLQVAAEELDLGMDQVSSATLETDVTPNQGGTYSSRAIRFGQPQLQRAAAEARQHLLALAAERLQVPVANLRVDNGLVTAGGDDAAFTTYGELIGDQRFELAFTGNAPVKPVDQYRLVAQPVRRKDIPLKAKGTYAYMQHQRLPGMLHGRIVRPRGQGAYRDGVQVVSIDDSSIAHILGARVLRKGNFVGVVAPREWDAVRAAEQLRVEWTQPASLPGSDNLYSRMEAAATTDRVAREEGDVGAYAGAPVKTEFAANLPYQAHVPFAPNCALADVRSGTALVMCSTQDIYGTRNSIAGLLGLDAAQVRVQYHEGAGTFGHSCWDDAAQAAAVMSQLAGTPVRVQFMRWDEHGWDTYGPAHIGKVKAAADNDGKLLSYEYEGWQHHWSLVDTTLQSANGVAASEWPAMAAQQINPLVLGGQYRIPNIRLLNHHVDGLDYLKGAWLRSPLDLAMAFVSEQAIDDLAYQLGVDPFEFRRTNIADERWLGVLEAAASASSWQPRRANAASADSTAANGASGDVVRGRGIGLGTHLASWGGAVAEIEVNTRTGAVRILHLYGAIDAGLVVNPSNVENQVIGQLVQTASRMLHEEVTFDTKSVTSLDWNTYPILRIADCPDVTPVIVQRLQEAPLGAGEEVMAAAAAAIANAFFDATGRRMRTFPFTPARVLAALA
ncbi:MAG TPA: molybdopterin cofactor-binding domain-containing protein [Pseudomonadales bacterium]